MKNRVKNKVIAFIDALSWLLLVLVFMLDDKKSSLTDVQLFCFVGGAVMFWAVAQLATAYYISSERDYAYKFQCWDDERRLLDEERSKEFTEMYHQTRFFENDFSFME